MGGGTTGLGSLKKVFLNLPKDLVRTSEGKQNYLEIRKRLRAGENVDGESSNLIELARKSIRSAKWN